MLFIYVHSFGTRFTIELIIPSGIWMISKVLIINELYNVGINCNFNQVHGSYYEDWNEYD